MDGRCISDRGRGGANRPVCHPATGTWPFPHRAHPRWQRDIMVNSGHAPRLPARAFAMLACCKVEKKSSFSAARKAGNRRPVQLHFLLELSFITSSVHFCGHLVIHSVIHRLPLHVAGRPSVFQQENRVMVTAIFSVLFAGAIAFAVLTMWRSFAPATDRLAYLAAYARHNDGHDWARVTYQPGPVFVPGPPPQFALHSSDSAPIAQVSVPKWQSWCRTGYVAPASVAAKWKPNALMKTGARCHSLWAPRPEGKLCDIIPDSHSRVAESSDYASLSSPPPHLSIGFLAAQSAAPRGLGAGQRLLA